MTIGKRIKARRKALGLSAEALAQRLGKSPATIYRYENGDIEKLPVDLLAPLAELLHTSTAYLLGQDEPAADSAARTITDQELKFALWGDADMIDDADLAAVRQYAAFIKERKQKDDPSGTL